jgi:hypothetical protein
MLSPRGASETAHPHSDHGKMRLLSCFMLVTASTHLAPTSPPHLWTPVGHGVGLKRRIFGARVPVVVRETRTRWTEQVATEGGLGARLRVTSADGGDIVAPRTGGVAPACSG